MKKILISFLLIITLIYNCSVSVYASDISGGGHARPSSPTDTTGFNNWDTGDKVAFWSANLPSILAGSIGLVVNPLNWNYNTWLNTFLSCGNNMGVALESDNFYDYVANMLSVNDNNELVVDDELMDIMYIATTQYIEKETGYTVFKTVDATKYADININNFKTKDQYRGFLNFCAENSSNIILCKKLFSNFTKCYDSEGNLADTTALNNGLEVLVIDLATTELYFGVNTSPAVLVNCVDENWEQQTYKSYVIGTDGNIYTCPNRDSNAQLGPLYIEGDYTKFGYKVIRYYSYNEIPYIPEGYNSYVINLGLGNQYMITQGGQSIRMYNTFSDLKQYTVGQRPYLAGEQFYNYDASVDNSTTITQTTLDNSITYGDLYNYITNNYDNPDGLSESQLADILGQYLVQNSGNGNNSGSGNNSGNSGTSGGTGLSGLLSGLGSIGDGLLAIIGKLLEYVGKAIELLSGTITKVIDLIPSNITNLFSALFPFVPEEWKVGIELGIVLGVIVGIVCIFKK